VGYYPNSLSRGRHDCERNESLYGNESEWSETETIGRTIMRTAFSTGATFLAVGLLSMGILGCSSPAPPAGSKSGSEGSKPGGFPRLDRMIFGEYPCTVAKDYDILQLLMLK